MSDEESEFFKQLVENLSHGYAAMAECELLREENTRLRAIVEAARAVWNSIPATYDPQDVMVRNHASALNNLGAMLHSYDKMAKGEGDENQR